MKTIETKVLLMEELIKFGGMTEEEAERHVEGLSQEAYDIGVHRTLRDRLDSNNFDTRNRRRGY